MTSASVSVTMARRLFAPRSALRPPGMDPTCLPTMSGLASPPIAPANSSFGSAPGHGPERDTPQHLPGIDVDRLLGDAVAIVMARFNISEAKAGAALIASGYRTQRSVTEVAASVVRSAANAALVRSLHPSTDTSRTDANRGDPLYPDVAE